MNQLIEMLHKLLELLESEELVISLRENRELREELELIFFKIWKTLRMDWPPILIREAVKLDRSSLSMIAEVTAEAIRGTPVTLFKCREKSKGNPCDRGLEVDIGGGKLRLRCPDHGSWEICSAKKV